MYRNEVCFGSFVARSGAFVTARALQSTENCNKKSLSLLAHMKDNFSL
jgi:hypothetical protein